MKLLLDERYAPITSGVGFVQAPLETAVAARRQFLDRVRANSPAGILEDFERLKRRFPTAVLYHAPEEYLQPSGTPSEQAEWRRPVNVYWLDEPFPEVLVRLEPLTGGGRERELWLETRSTWTAVFQNAALQPDPDTAVRILSESLRCRGAVVWCARDILPREGTRHIGQCGSVQLWSYWPAHGGQGLDARTVGAVKDGGRWVFDAYGPVQPFEQLEHYRARRIRERFTPEMLERYCAALGIRYFDPGFYGARGALIEQGHVNPYQQPYTLAEAQAEVGIDLDPRSERADSKTRRSET